MTEQNRRKTGERDLSLNYLSRGKYSKRRFCIPPRSRRFGLSYKNAIVRGGGEGGKRRKKADENKRNKIYGIPRFSRPICPSHPSSIH